jgi:hypothetical protein
MYVNRVAVGFQRQFHDIHRAHHSGAKSPRPYPYQRLGPVIGAMNCRQRQFALRNWLYFT